MLNQLLSLSSQWRARLAIGAGVLILVAVNFSIYQREQLLDSGRIVLLQLTPVDPRSLMQGDYMALNFKVADEAFGWGGSNLRRLQGDPNGSKLIPAEDGYLVVLLNAQGVGKFVRIAQPFEKLMSSEALLRYRIRNEQVKFATNGYFFQEGTAVAYEKAHYGEFRVAKNGDMILTGLRGEDYRPLQAQVPEKTPELHIE